MITDSEELVSLGKEIVEGITGKRFPGPVEIIPGGTSWARGNGKTEICLAHVEGGLETVIRIGAHEIEHHYDNCRDGREGRERRAGEFADEVISTIKKEAFSDLEPTNSLRAEAARRFGGLKSLSQEQIAERYEKTLTTLGGDRIDPNVAKKAASILAEENLRRGVTRVTVDESVLQPHHIKMVEEQEELRRIYYKSLSSHGRSRL